MLLSCSVDGVRVFDHDASYEARGFLFQNAAQDMSWCSTQNLLAVGCEAGKIGIWDANGMRKPSITSPQIDEKYISIAQSEDGTVLAAVTVTGTVQVWERQGSVIHTRWSKPGTSVTCLTITKEEGGGVGVLACGTREGELQLFDIDGNSVGKVSSSGGKQPIVRVRASPFVPHLVVTANADGGVTCCDIHQLVAIHEFGLEGEHKHSQVATGIAFSPINHLLMCSVGVDGTILLYDVHQQKCVKRLTAVDSLTCVTFLPNGYTLAIGTATGNVLVFDLRSREGVPQRTLHAHSGPVSAIAVCTARTVARGASSTRNDVPGSPQRASPVASSFSPRSISLPEFSAAPANPPSVVERQSVAQTWSPADSTTAEAVVSTFQRVLSPSEVNAPPLTTITGTTATPVPKSASPNTSSVFNLSPVTPSLVTIDARANQGSQALNQTSYQPSGRRSDQPSPIPVEVTPISISGGHSSHGHHLQNSPLVKTEHPSKLVSGGSNGASDAPRSPSLSGPIHSSPATSPTRRRRNRSRSPPPAAPRQPNNSRQRPRDRRQSPSPPERTTVRDAIREVTYGASAPSRPQTASPQRSARPDMRSNPLTHRVGSGGMKDALGSKTSERIGVERTSVPEPSGSWQKALQDAALQLQEGLGGQIQNMHLEIIRTRMQLEELQESMASLQAKHTQVLDENAALRERVAAHGKDPTFSLSH